MNDDIQQYDPQAIELKWQRHWAESGSYAARDDLPREQCYYVLEMFPYPSGKLHMGHVRNYSIGDAVARYQRLRGKHVLHPMGWDSFGLPAEQAAIDRGEHPRNWTYENIAYMRSQLQRMGFSYDWNREFATSDPGYSHREQELFLDLVEQGLVYRKSSLVNWSTGLNTVLANEQVVYGKCWRTDTPVIQKELPQWFLRTTHYTEELLQGLDELTGWPEAVRTQQRHWIGPSAGAEIDFAIADHDAALTVYTTRPDTLFGVTFMSLAPEHPLVDQLVSAEQASAVAALREELRGQSAEQRSGDQAEKKGVFTGAYAINPANDQRVPIFVANFVLLDYGTGAVMAVPAHDHRDFAFARAYDLPIQRVILGPDQDPEASMDGAWVEGGSLINSGPFNGQDAQAAKAAITTWLHERGQGRARTTYRYRDWGLSRQRYWGNPIPYVYGEVSGAVPLRKQDLPVTLPTDVTFDGLGNPLEKHPTWRHQDTHGQPLSIRGPDGVEAVSRETDTMDTFVQSSWYFARYTCPDAEGPLDPRRVDHWLPVDLYIGGIEHACMHLLYARFFQKALCDMDYSQVREPFKNLLCQGMVVKETFSTLVDGKRVYHYADDVDIVRDDKGAVVSATLKTTGAPVEVGRIEKMSKSKNNGVDPQLLIDEYGADTARLFILFAAPPEKELLWNDQAVSGCFKFLRRLWHLGHDNAALVDAAAAFSGRAADATSDADKALLRKAHGFIKRATTAMETDFGFNAVVASCMELANHLKPQALSPEVFAWGYRVLLRLLAPMTPHICHELWQRFGDGGELDAAGWPQYIESELAADIVTYPVQIKGKVRARIDLPASLTAPADIEAGALQSDVVRPLIEGASIRKVVVVPGKIINIITS
ncbi:MAG: leucine--tRNA ligase [Planctomycetota bacterium]|nr:MAG: leucine--tRNA ligase [Planctomycetota bacterium]